jgi:hypothetical protein
VTAEHRAVRDPPAISAQSEPSKEFFMFRRALKAVGVSAAALAAGAGSLAIVVGTASTAGAATNIPNAIQPIGSVPAGTFDSGQPVDVVVSASAGSTAGFTAGSAIFILECAAPGGNDPVSTTQCDGNTGYAGGSITVNSDDSLDVTGGSAPSTLPYTMYALPDLVTLGENSSAGATCGLGSPNDCVLYIGEGGGGDTGMAKPHVFSQFFQIHPDSTDSGTSSPGNGALGTDAAPGAITTANNATFTKGVTSTFNIHATGYGPPTFTETGALPPGVHLTTTFTGLTSTGVLAGHPTQSGSFPIVITASNGIGTPTTQNFTLKVNAPPAITSPNSDTFTQGAAGTFTVTATGFPAPTFSEVGSLPGGVTLSSAGVLAGTPTATGSFPITITAQNGVSPNATQAFTLTVSPPAGFQITTSSLPPATIGMVYGPIPVETSGAATGATVKIKKLAPMPKGLKVKAGLIQGTPSTKLVPGTFSVQLSATEKYSTVVGKVKTKHVVIVTKTLSLQVNA